MSVEELINQENLPALWREFKSSRDALQNARDRVLQVIVRMKKGTDFLSVADDAERKLVDDTEAILKDTIQ